MAAVVVAALTLCSAACFGACQQPGHEKTEEQPPLNFKRTWKAPDDFSLEKATLTLDAQFRWLHNANGYNNCFDGAWDAELCPDPEACARNCAVDGVDAQTYENTYGIRSIPEGVEMKFGTGENFGSRVYAIEGSKYKLFKLKNMEFTFDVDVSNVPCGLNAAAYFVEMDAEGNLGAGGNDAGAEYGMGYCDAQCPKAIKFINGEANVLDWDANAGAGRYGACCAEMDIFEGNRNASAMTTHPCTNEGLHRCEGGDCKNQCDGDGCQYEPWHAGVQTFYGVYFQDGVDTSKPFSVVTQFLTDDDTDDGELVEIRRYYLQAGKTIFNPYPRMKGDEFVALNNDNSINKRYCQTGKNLSGTLEDGWPADGGYLKKMGEAIGRGMVLVLSIWDDPATNMAWLDSTARAGEKVQDFQHLYGPCFGDVEDVRAKYPDASVKYSNFRYGGIRTTCPECKDPTTTTTTTVTTTTTTRTRTSSTTTTSTMTTTTSTVTTTTLALSKARVVHRPWVRIMAALVGLGALLGGIFGCLKASRVARFGAHGRSAPLVAADPEEE